MSDFDLTAARRYRARLQHQRAYQASYRERLKRARSPERDDVAAAALAYGLAAAQRNPEIAERWTAVVVRRLAEAGFDKGASDKRIRSMIDRAGHERQPRN